MAWAAANLYEGDGTKSAQCSASSEHTTYIAENAFDAAAGGVDDCWISDDSNTPEIDGSCYLEFNFTTTMYIGGLQIQRRTSAAGEMTNYPKDIVVKAKRTADADWTTVKTATLTSPADGAWGDEVAFAPIYASHWDVLRIEFHSVHYRGAVGWNVCVKEVRFLGCEKCGELTTYITADLKGTVVAEYVGGDTDWGYVGAAAADKFAFQYRGHDSRADQYVAAWFWAEPGSGEYPGSPAPAFRTETVSYHSKGTTYYIAIFDKADIEGLYCNAKIYMSANYYDNYVRLYDSAVNYQSMVQFPNDAAFVPPAGAGLLQTILSQTGSGTATAHVIIDTSGATGTYVTLMVTLDKNSDVGNSYVDLYAWNLSNLPIIQAFSGEADLPLGATLGTSISYAGDVSLPTFSIEAVCEGGFGYAELPTARPEQVTNEIDITAGFALEAIGYIPLSGDAKLPVPNATGLVGGTQLVDLPTGIIRGACVVGFFAVGDDELPVPMVAGVTGWDGVVELPAGPLAGAGYVGALARAVGTLPAPGVEGVGSAAQMFSGEARLPILRITGTCPATSWFRGNAVVGFALGAVGVVGITASGEAAIDFFLGGNTDVSGLGVGSAKLPAPTVVGHTLIAVHSYTATGLLKFHRGF